MRIIPFIQFKPKQHFNTNAKIFDFESICLDPKEFYLQTIDIELSNDVEVKLVDCNDNILQDVLFFKNEYHFEFTIQNEYFYPVKLKVVDNGQTYYSNPFVCYENELSLRIDYKFLDYFQSIRLNGYFSTVENESNVDTYVKFDGNKLSGFSTITTKKNYIFERSDNFNVLALNNALAFPIVYINGERVTDKPILKGGSIEGQSNEYGTELQACVNLEDTYKPVVQIAEPLKLINATPQGVFTLDSFVDSYQLTFNHNVTQNTSAPIIILKDDVFFLNLNVTNINNNVVTLGSFASPLYSNGNYKVIIPENKFNSFFGSHLELFYNFVIQNADYSENDYSNDYFIN